MEPRPLFTEDRAKELGIELVPWVDEDRNEGVVEGRLRDSLAAHQPLVAFKGVFATDKTFKRRLERVRGHRIHGPHRVMDHGLAVDVPFLLDDDVLNAATRPYAWNGGRPLEVMREVVFRVAAARSSDLTLTILNFPPVPGAGLDVPTTEDRWKKSGNYRLAAVKLARLGAGKCLAVDCPRSTDRTGAPHKSRIRYCIDHSRPDRLGAKSYAERQDRADQEAMRALLHGVGDVLGI